MIFFKILIIVNNYDANFSWWHFYCFTFHPWPESVLPIVTVSAIIFVHSDNPVCLHCFIWICVSGALVYLTVSWKHVNKGSKYTVFEKNKPGFRVLQKLSHKKSPLKFWWSIYSPVNSKVDKRVFVSWNSSSLIERARGSYDDGGESTWQKSHVTDNGMQVGCLTPKYAGSFSA